MRSRVAAGVVQLVESAHYAQAMPEEYIMIMETDHMLMHARSARVELALSCYRVLEQDRVSL